MDKRNADVDSSARMSRLAVASLVISLIGLAGILTCVWFESRWATSIASICLSISEICLPLGLVFGIIAAVQIKLSHGRLRGRSTALSGIWIVGLLILVVMFTIPRPNGCLHEPCQSPCHDNLKQLGMAMLQYAQNHDGHMPPAYRWNEALSPYIHKPLFARISKTFICPAAGDRKNPSYAMNRRLDRISFTDIESPTDTVLLFDSVPGKNQAGGPELLPNPSRHNGCYDICFADGHVKTMLKKNVLQLIWDPRKKAASQPGPGPKSD